MEHANGGPIGGAEPPGARARLARVGGWFTADTSVVTLTVVAQNVLRLVSSLVLTRILSPDAFGIVGLLNTLYVAVTMITDLGFQTYLIRHADSDDESFVDAVWTIRLVRSVMLTALAAAIGLVLTFATDQRQLGPAIAVFSVMFLVEGTASTSLMLAYRRGQVLKASLIEVSVSVMQLIVSVGFALWLRSFWAIVIGLIAGNALATLLSYRAFPGERRRLRFDRAVSRDLWAFSKYIVGSSMLTLAVVQFDKLLLSPSMPLHEFGLYMLASNLVMPPRVFADAYASRILYPHLAHAWREAPATLGRAFYAKTRAVAPLYGLAVGAMIGGAPLIVRLLYDPRYEGAAFYFALLGVGSLFSFTNATATQALVAMGHVRVGFFANIARTGWLVLAGLPAAFLGNAPTVVVVFSLAEGVAMLFNWVALRRHRVLDLRWEMLPFVAAAVGAGLGWGAYRAISSLVSL